MEAQRSDSKKEIKQINKKNTAAIKINEYKLLSGHRFIFYFYFFYNISNMAPWQTNKKSEGKKTTCILHGSS